MTASLSDNNANAAGEKTERHIELSQRLLDFISGSPSAFHATQNFAMRLGLEGFERLLEGDNWTLKPGGKYYVVRNGSSLIAFAIGDQLDSYHFQVCATHTDSPTFRVKAIPEIEGPGEYLRLNTEPYGSMINNTWLDRPLSVAGRVMVDYDGVIKTRLLNVQKDIILIPNLSIHQNRQINEGGALSRQIDLCPLFSAGALKRGDFANMIGECLNVPAQSILGYELSLVNRQPGCIWGYKDEFISSPQLDDLMGSYAAAHAFVRSHNPHTVNVLALFDNEEVGSITKQGAMSRFLSDTLSRVNESLGKTHQDFIKAVSESFLVSCDNAHALHPNHPERYDVHNVPHINKGIVIKEAASQKYVTDAFSRAAFTAICKKNGIPCQTFANHGDYPGGKTLGNLLNVQLSMHAVDVGMPQLAMHSAYETAGSRDTMLAIDALSAFYNTDLRIYGDKDLPGRDIIELG